MRLLFPYATRLTGLRSGNTPYEKIGDEIVSLDVPFTIPDSWEWARSSDILNIVMGQSPDGDSANGIFSPSL